MGQKTVLGLIPARSGSKGVPRKNIRLLCGQPLINYTIKAALNTNTLDRVIVSTDDDEIASVAKQAGAEVPFLRPTECATDTATLMEVIKHVIVWLNDNEQYCPDAVALLPPTSPLRTTEQIDSTINLLWKSGLDSAVTICPVQNHPYFIYSRDKNNQLLEFVTKPNKPKRRQELPEYYVHCQSVIVSLTDYFKKCDNSNFEFNHSSVVGYEIGSKSALDIDTPEDFLIAEAFMH
jgi:CMP-N-acetylneuraminic acid synthetase